MLNIGMTRVKIIRDHKQLKSGQTLTVSPNVAFGLIDSGVAELTKDMTTDDYRTRVKVKGPKEK